MLRAPLLRADETVVSERPAPSPHAFAQQAATRHCHFLGVEIELGPGVLVPRAETELLGEGAIDLIAGADAPIVIDMCCGSGNLALAIAARIATAQVTASDLTDETVEVARRNAVRLGLAHRVGVLQGDLFAAEGFDALAGLVDLIVCNPPYISTKRLESDRAYLLESEPREAFDGGPYGVSIQQRLVRDALRFLKPGGWLAFEFGHGQEKIASGLIARSGSYRETRFLYDEDGAPRVALAQAIS